jgi:hypothetical protein
MGPAQGSPQELASQDRISAIQERARDQQRDEFIRTVVGESMLERQPRTNVPGSNHTSRHRERAKTG